MWSCFSKVRLAFETVDHSTDAFLLLCCFADSAPFTVSDEFVALAAVDKQGEVYTASDAQVEICLEDGLELAGFGSADPYSTEPMDAAAHRLFRGRALAALRGTQPGQWKCTLQMAGEYAPVTLTLDVV